MYGICRVVWGLQGCIYITGATSWGLFHGPLARYVKLRVAYALGMPGTFSPPPRVSDPDMHHGTCVSHVSWCMSGSLTSGFLWSRWRKNVPSIPGACAIRNSSIWWEAYAEIHMSNLTSKECNAHSDVLNTMPCHSALASPRLQSVSRDIVE